MKILIILNDPPYGTERSYNGPRLAKALKNDADPGIAELYSDFSSSRQRAVVAETMTNAHRRAC